MENAGLLANQVFVMFLLIAVGYVLYRIRVIGDHTADEMTTVLLQVVVPALVIQTYQVEYTEEKARELTFAFLLAALAMAVGLAVSFFVRIRADSETGAVEQFASCFSNTGFMGIPLVTAILGTTGVFYSNTYMMVFQLTVWTFGYHLMQKNRQPMSKKILKDMLCNPTIISVFVGVLLFFLRIRLPHTVQSACTFLADMNTPLAMLLSGVCMAKADLLSAVKRLRNYYVALLKLLIIPLLIALCFAWLPVKSEIRLAILIVAACPTASNTILFASKYGRDVNIASQLMALSTVLCILTLPIVLLCYGAIAV